MLKPLATSQTFSKVAPDLYRIETGQYYGRIKRHGKIHKQSLDTTDFQTAKRNLSVFKKEVENVKDSLPNMPFHDFIKRWLERVKSHLKDIKAIEQ